MSFWFWLKNLFTKKVIAVKPVPKPNPVSIPDVIETEKPLWLYLARKEIGQKEIRNGENPRIIEYHASTSLKASEDEVPWCASFVCWCLEQAGVVSTKSAWARHYLNWGVKLDKPKYGCVVIFSRGVNSGHVGFWIDEGATSVTVLGGNQADSVCISKYSKGNILGYRWP